MGLTITGKYDGAPSWLIGYASFFRLRRDIAYSVSKEFGDHYSKLPNACILQDASEYDKETERLIKKYHCKKRFLDFLYQPDTDGKLSPEKCRAVLNQIAYGVETEEASNAIYGYSAYPDQCMSIYDFIDLLTNCIAKKKYLVWY